MQYASCRRGGAAGGVKKVRGRRVMPPSMIRKPSGTHHVGSSSCVAIDGGGGHGGGEGFGVEADGGDVLGVLVLESGEAPFAAVVTLLDSSSFRPRFVFLMTQICF